MGVPLRPGGALGSLRHPAVAPGTPYARGSSLVEFLAPEQTDQAFSAVANGQTCLLDLYDEAVRRGAVHASKLKEIPEEEFVVQGVPRPPGYCAQTVLHFGRMGVATLLDYGATCTAMPEEVAMSIISHALETYDDGNDPQYPICRMHKYRTTRTMDGVAAGKPLEIRYGLVLRAEFVGAGGDSGPMRDLYFKILPKGMCSIAGCLVGFPVLDVRPYGLGHTVQHTTHCFEELGAALPRLELARRSEYVEALSVYLDTDGERCSALDGTPEPLSRDHCRLLRERVFEIDAAVFPCAVADCGACLHQPKEEALVPAVWDRPLAEGAHYCVSTAGTQLSTGLEAQPGVCGSESPELMIA